ncbi:MAG: prepilin-type N-terminal cleavage/methylation domain-containing protein [Desulfobacterales bacterium]|jgi:general secretion pathway protein I
MSPSADRGFTLLEILASIAILAIVLTALFRLHLQTLSMGTDAGFYAKAPLLAQEKIAQIEAEGIEQPRSDSGDFGEDFPRYRWESEIVEPESADFETTFERLRRIEVRILDAESRRAFALRTYRILN